MPQLKQDDNRGEEKRGEAYKSFLYAGIALAAGVWFWSAMVGHPIDDLRLLRSSLETRGTLVERHEDEVEDERGKVHLTEIGRYTFEAQGGRVFETRDNKPRGDLAEEVVVQYLPHDPSVSRIKGEGCQSLSEWIFRKFVLGLVLLGLFVSPGIAMVKGGLKEWRVGTKN